MQSIFYHKKLRQGVFNVFVDGTKMSFVACRKFKNPNKVHLQRLRPSLCVCLSVCVCASSHWLDRLTSTATTGEDGCTGSGLDPRRTLDPLAHFYYQSMREKKKTNPMQGVVAPRDLELRGKNTGKLKKTKV